MVSFCLPFRKGRKSFTSLPEGSDAAGDHVKVRPHAAWGLQPCQHWVLGSRGFYCKVQLGVKKARTQVAKGPDPAWDAELTLPYDGEEIVHLSIVRHCWGLRNQVLGSCSFALPGLPAGGVLSDLTLRGPQSVPCGFLSVSILLELTAEDSPLPGPRGGAFAPDPQVDAPACPSEPLVQEEPGTGVALRDLSLDDEEIHVVTVASEASARARPGAAAASQPRGLDRPAHDKHVN